MSISMELLIMIIINVLLGGVYIGGLAMAIKFIEKQIERLEQKQDLHNSVIERTYACEASLKAEHKRLDEQGDDIKRLQGVIFNRARKV